MVSDAPGTVAPAAHLATGVAPGPLTNHADPVTVVLVDDHAVLRHGLAVLLGASAGIEVVAEAGSRTELLLALRSGPVDVCVLDLSLPDADGLDVLSELAAVAPTTAALVLTARSEAAYGTACLDAGAAGFLTKSCEPEEIVRAVRCVARGQVYVPPELAAIVVRRRGAGPAPDHTSLSQRELSVLVRLARGQSNGEISRELNVDQRTVSTFRRRVLDKLGLATNADLVRYAVAHGLVDGTEGLPPAGGVDDR